MSRPESLRAFDIIHTHYCIRRTISNVFVTLAPSSKIMSDLTEPSLAEMVMFPD